MNRKVRVKAPATVSNLNCGFDVLGLALKEPFDIIEMELTDTGLVEIIGIEGCQDLSLDPEKNVVGAVLKAMLQKVNHRVGFRVKIEKGINPGSGIGSSAASSAGASYAGNILLDKRFTEIEMVAFAMEGEKLASGSAHADNVAPAVMGGITLVRSYQPLEIVKIHIPAELYCVIIHPDLEVKTSDARNVLDKHIPLNIAVKQWGNVGGLIAGLYREDYDLISNSLTDYIAEPKRSAFIPHFYELKSTALSNGALGAGISGSGPSIFALCRGEKSALKVHDGLISLMKSVKIGFRDYISAVSKEGAAEF